MKREFGKATGIQAEFVRLSSGAALARVRAEKASPTFDVWFGGSGDSHWVAQAEGLLEFFRPQAWGELRPQLTKAVDGHYIPLYTGLHGFGVNEKLLKEKGLAVPETWKELGDARYRGLVATPNPNTSGTGYVMMTTIVQVYGEEPGFELLKAIHRNVAQYTRSGGDPSLLAGRGEVGIGVSFANDVVERARKGFSIRFVAPKDGTGYEIGAPLTQMLASGETRLAPVASRGQEWTWSVEGMRAAARAAERLGVRIAIEPLNRYEAYLVTTVAEGLAYIGAVDSPHVGLTVDLFHANIEEPDIPASILAAGSRLWHVQVADTNRRALGRGHADLRAIFDALRRIRYEGALVVEVMAPGPDPFRAIKDGGSPAILDQDLRESHARLRALTGVATAERTRE